MRNTQPKTQRACSDLCVFSVFFCFFLTATDKDPRRSLTAGGSLILKDVNFGDTAIYQCQASNKHGTILVNANVYVIGECLLYTCHLFNSFLCVYFCVCVCVSHLFVCVVSELPAQIMTEDMIMYTFTEGSKATLDCETFGSPKPKVIW